MLLYCNSLVNILVLKNPAESDKFTALTIYLIKNTDMNCIDFTLLADIHLYITCIPF